MSMRTIAGIIVLALIGLGCVGTKVHFADAPVDKLDLSRGHKVTGRASGLHLFGCIPIGINDRQAKAYEMLQEEAGDDYLTDIRIQDSWKFVIIGWKYSTILTATAYPDKNTAANAAVHALTGKLATLKALHDKGELSDAEYEAARAARIKALSN